VANLLVVDDSPLVLNLTREILSEAGHQVVTADNPLTLPNLIRHTNFDLALVDLNMPTIQGDVVTTILQRAGLPTSKVVLFSEAPEDELKTLGAVPNCPDRARGPRRKQRKARGASRLLGPVTDEPRRDAPRIGPLATGG
jgi:CheY-like chemotaxis protein